MMGILSFLLIIWIITLNTRLFISSYADPVYSICIVHYFYFYLHRDTMTNHLVAGSSIGLYRVCLQFHNPQRCRNILQFNCFLSYWVAFDLVRIFRKDVNLKLNQKLL